MRGESGERGKRNGLPLTPALSPAVSGFREKGIARGGEGGALGAVPRPVHPPPNDAAVASRRDGFSSCCAGGLSRFVMVASVPAPFRIHPGLHRMSLPPRVVIVGGGFAGLHAARALRSSAVRVTLVDRRNFHLFQPLLYQVATGGLSPGNIAAPLRAVFRKQRNCEVVLAEVDGFDLARRRLVLADGELEYDTLLVCAGARTSYFGKDQWAENAPGLKTIEDAIEIRRRVLTAFEAAERETDPARRKAWLTFVVVGGGPTGVELAGTLAEIARYTLDREYRNINPSDARIIVVDASDRILSSFDERLAAYATGRLNQLGVEVRSFSRVEDVRPGGATISDKDKNREEIACETVLWGAGVLASPLGTKLAEGRESPRHAAVAFRSVPTSRWPGIQRSLCWGIWRMSSRTANRCRKWHPSRFSRGSTSRGCWPNGRGGPCRHRSDTRIWEAWRPSDGARRSSKSASGNGPGCSHGSCGCSCT